MSARAAVRALLLLAALAASTAAAACQPEVKDDAGEAPPLNPTSTTLPPNAGAPGREAVSCDSSYFDGRTLSADEPLGLPLEFPGAPDGSDLCGVDDRTGAVAYTSALAPDAVTGYYAFLLPLRGCSVEPATESPTTGDLSLRYACPSGAGTIVVAADAGAYDVTPDEPRRPNG